jgi:hypothetical protein
LNPHRTRNHGSREHRESIKRMLDKTKKDNRVKVLRGKLQKVALNLTENVKYNMTNFMKRPEAQKTRFEKELWGDMLATNSKDKMQLLTNLEATRDDKILERDEDGDIVDSLGDTRGTALVHSFSEENPHGIVSPIDKGEQEYQQTKALIKTTADGTPPRMTQERATRTLDDIEKGNARKSRRSVDSTYKFKVSKLQARLQKIATDINRSPVDNTMSKSDEIINSFQNSGLSIEGVDGVYDTENHKILDANNSDDVERLRGLYGKDKYIGTNSETDTRDGPNTNDLERTRKELQDIEDKGGIPALGFDSTEGGSLEALNVSVVNSKEEVLQALNKNQWGTGVLHPNGKFEIVKSLKYIGRNK